MSRVRDPAERHRVGWMMIGFTTAALCVWLGVGFAIGGIDAENVHGWRVLLRLEGGNIRVHGVIMFALGLLLAIDIRGPFTRSTLWTLRVLRTYSFVVALCWFDSWFEYGVQWGAPAWWVLLAVLTVYLSNYGPTSPAADAAPDTDVGVDRV